MKKILENNLLDLFMDNVKEKVNHEVRLFEPKPLDNAFSLQENLKVNYMATRRVFTNTYTEGNVSTPNITHPTRLTS